MRWPLARQILLPMVGILLLTVGLASALTAWLASRQVKGRIEAQLADVAQTLATANFPLESNVLQQTRGLTGMELVLVDPASVAAAASDERLIDLAAQPAAAEGTLDVSRTVTSGSRSFFHSVITVDRRPVGGSRQTLHVFYPQDAWQAARWQATWPPLAIGGVAILLVAAAALAIARHVTQPIQRLRSQVARIAQGDFQSVTTPSRDDEVRDLAVAVNQMADKLADYETKTRQQERLSTLGTLGGGIAHQIRNAATGCRIAIDLHQRDCPLCETGDDGEGPLAVATRQLQLIETHIQRFLMLGRPSPSERAAVDLTEVVQAAILLVEPAAQHVGAQIEFRPPAEPAAVLADRQSLEQMLVNLLVNAVQAAAGVHALVGGGMATDAPGVVVRLARPESGRCQILVGDCGPGPAPAIQNRLFEPFATDKPGGTGLGLVVARRIAEDHGGTIDWKRDDERTWFVVELPLLKTPLLTNGAG